MFKSLRLRLMTIFVLLVLAIMTVAGTFLVLQVYMSQHTGFKNDMLELFTPEYVSALGQKAASVELYVINAVKELE